MYKAAWSAAERVFKSDINKDDDIANAASGILIWALHSYNGTDRLGRPFLMETQHIATNMGLYDKSRVASAYDSSFPRRSRARAIFAWGVHNWGM